MMPKRCAIKQFEELISLHIFKHKQFMENVAFKIKAFSIIISRHFAELIEVAL